MAEEYGLIAKSTLTAIANATRAKLETYDKMLPSDMAGLIAEIGGDWEVNAGNVTSYDANYFQAEVHSTAHGLSGKPDFFVAYTESYSSNSNWLVLSAYYNGVGEAIQQNSNRTTTFCDETTITFCPYPAFFNGSCRWVAGRKVK